MERKRGRPSFWTPWLCTRVRGRGAECRGGGGLRLAGGLRRSGSAATAARGPESGGRQKPRTRRGRRLAGRNDPAAASSAASIDHGLHGSSRIGSGHPCPAARSVVPSVESSSLGGNEGNKVGGQREQRARCASIPVITSPMTAGVRPS